MEQQNKRFKTTKESTVSEIVASIGSIAESLKSIAESHESILKANRLLVTYLQDKEKAEKGVKLDTQKPSTDLEQ